MFSFGPAQALEWAANACRSFHSGAMVVMARLNLETRVLEICSVGDASCNVYVAPITWSESDDGSDHSSARSHHGSLRKKKKKIFHLNPHELFHRKKF